MAEALLATAGDAPGRAPQYSELKDQLLAHARAGERFFYWLPMKHDAGVDPCRHAVAEHQEMDGLLETLERTDPSSPSWIAAARKLKDKIFHHPEDEEHGWFRQAGKLPADQRKTTLATRYLKPYQEAWADRRSPRLVTRRAVHGPARPRHRG